MDTLWVMLIKPLDHFLLPCVHRCVSSEPEQECLVFSYWCFFSDDHGITPHDHHCFLRFEVQVVVDSVSLSLFPQLDDPSEIDRILFHRSPFQFR